MRLFIGNVDNSLELATIYRLFSPHGTLASIALKDGFAFVAFETAEGAQKAIEALNGHEIGGRKFLVEPSKEPDSDRRNEMTKLCVTGFAGDTSEADVKKALEGLQLAGELTICRRDGHSVVAVAAFASSTLARESLEKINSAADSSLRAFLAEQRRPKPTNAFMRSPAAPISAMTPRRMRAGPQPFGVQLLIQNRMVGAIIGKAGVTIKDITVVTGAKIDVQPRDEGVGQERIVYISGALDSIGAAFRVLVEKLEEEALHQTEASASAAQAAPAAESDAVAEPTTTTTESEGKVEGESATGTQPESAVASLTPETPQPLKQHDAAQGQGLTHPQPHPHPHPHPHPQTPPTEAQVEVKLLVLNEHVGHVIGKGGAFIRKVMADSGAFLTVTVLEEPIFHPHRCIVITGSVDACCIAQTAICEKLATVFAINNTAPPGPPTGASAAVQHAMPHMAPHHAMMVNGRPLHPHHQLPYLYPHAAMPGVLPQSMMPQYVQPITEQVVMHVEDTFIGAIIGKGGVYIKEITRLSSAKVHVERQAPAEEAQVEEAQAEEAQAEANKETPEKEADDKETPEKKSGEPLLRRVIIIGTPDAQQRAQHLIYQKCQSLLGQQEPVSAGAPVSELVMRVDYIVDVRLVGRIIGKSGSNIREMVHVTCARMEVQRVPEGASTANLSIWGNIRQSLHAQALVRQMTVSPMVMPFHAPHY